MNDLTKNQEFGNAIVSNGRKGTSLRLKVFFLPLVLVSASHLSMEESVDSLTICLQPGREYTTDFELVLDVETSEGASWLPDDSRVLGRKDTDFSGEFCVEYTTMEIYEEDEGEVPNSFLKDIGPVSFEGEYSLDFFGGEGSNSTSRVLLPEAIDYEWNPKLNKYEGTLSRGSERVTESQEELLNTIAPRFPIESLLPGKNVTVNEKWDIELEPWIDIVFPLGDASRYLPSFLGDLDVDPDPKRREPKFIKKALAGESGGEYLGVVMMDSRKVHKIELYVDGSISVNFSSLLDSLAMGLIRPKYKHWFALSGTSEMTFDFQADGFLYVDLELSSLNLLELSFEYEAHHSTPIFFGFLYPDFGEYEIGEAPGGYLEGMLEGSGKLSIRDRSQFER